MFRIRSQPPEIFSKELRYNQTDPVRTDINISMVSLKKKNAQEITKLELVFAHRIEIWSVLEWEKKSETPEKNLSNQERLN